MNEITIMQPDNDHSKATGDNDVVQFENVKHGMDNSSEMPSPYIKFQSVKLICVLVIMLHFVIIIGLSGQSNSDDVDLGDNELHTTYRRKRHLQSKSADDDHMSRISAKEHKSNFQVNNSSQFDSPNRVYVRTRDLCASTHTQDLAGSCQAVGCLRKLTLPLNAEHTLTKIPNEFFMELQKSRGKLHRIHIDMVSLLTHIQWHNGVFGSVAVLGDTIGLLTKLLCTYTNFKQGEHIIIASVPLVGLHSKHEKWIQHSMPAEALSNNLHFFSGYTNFSKVYFLPRDIPQFRLVSINAVENFSELSHLIEMSACVIREGGILILDNSQSDVVNNYVAHYFNKYGNTAIQPLLVTNNKIYLCSPRWKVFYTERLLQNQSILSSFNMLYDHLFNSATSYLVSV